MFLYLFYWHGVNHFCEEFLFLLMGNGIRDQDLSARCATGVSAFSALSADRVRKCLHVYIHIDTHTSVLKHIYIYTYIYIYKYTHSCILRCIYTYTCLRNHESTQLPFQNVQGSFLYSSIRVYMFLLYNENHGSQDHQHIYSIL